MDSVAAQLFQAYERRDWPAARRLLTDDAMMIWHTSREQFSGADAIIHVNAVYPEGWHITLLEDNVLEDGRLHTIIRVEHGEQSFFANSLFHTRNGLISQIDEYWATAEEPQRWRVVLPGWNRLMG